MAAKKYTGVGYVEISMLYDTPPLLQDPGIWQFWRFLCIAHKNKYYFSINELAPYLMTVDCQLIINCQSSITQLSISCQSTVNRPSINCQSIVRNYQKGGARNE